MGFAEEIITYIDQDNLIGARPNPEKWSTGNALIETGTALMILKKRNEYNLELLQRLSNGIKACETGGTYNKNPGRTDEITHDDLIGVIAGYYCAFGVGPKSFRFVQYGISHGWDLSNTGKPYFTGFAKPWHIAFYMLAAGLKPSLWDKLSLFVSILLNGFLSMSDASGKKLTWLMVESIQGRDGFIDLVIKIWRRRINKVYGGIQGVMAMYYGENHPFSKYAV